MMFRSPRSGTEFGYLAGNEYRVGSTQNALYSTIKNLIKPIIKKPQQPLNTQEEPPKAPHTAEVRSVRANLPGKKKITLHKSRAEH